jgi:hypothetical protein
MRKAIFSVVFVVTFLAGASVVSAQWRQLGSKEVDYNVDHDTIGVGAMKGDLRRIQLRVQRAPVRFERVVVNYRNGGTQEVPVRELIRAGGSTRSIDLNGKERVISSVDLWYESASLRRRKARVTLWGRD